MRRILWYCSTAGCCGVTQLTGFSDEPNLYDNGDIEVRGNSLAEIYQSMFKQLMDIDPQERHDTGDGRVLQIWFYKARNYDDVFPDTYVAEELRQLIAGIPGVIDLGEHLNPNSGNMIQGYQWEWKPNE